VFNQTLPTKWPEIVDPPSGWQRGTDGKAPPAPRRISLKGCAEECEVFLQDNTLNIDLF
jgi:hypothetical protein